MSMEDEDSSSILTHENHPFADVGILDTVPLFRTPITNILNNGEIRKTSAPRLGVLDSRFVPYEDSPVKSHIALANTEPIPPLNLDDTDENDSSWMPFASTEQMRKYRKHTMKSLVRAANERVQNTVTNLVDGETRFIGYNAAPYFFANVKHRLEEGEDIYLVRNNRWDEIGLLFEPHHLVT